jgi:hypothetical protein
MLNVRKGLQDYSSCYGHLDYGFLNMVFHGDLVHFSMQFVVLMQHSSLTIRRLLQCWQKLMTKSRHHMDTRYDVVAV